MNLKQIKKTLAIRELEEQEFPDKYKSSIRLVLDGYHSGEISYTEIEPYLSEIGEQVEAVALEILSIVNSQIDTDIKDLSKKIINERNNQANP